MYNLCEIFELHCERINLTNGVHACMYAQDAQGAKIEIALTSRLFVRPTNDIIYCTFDNQFNRAVFSEYAPLQRSDHCQHSTHTNFGHFSLCGKRAYALFLPRVGSRHFFPFERRRRRSEVT